MSDFEYLSNLSIGQYLPIQSFFHRRDPRAKIAGIVLLVISLTLTYSIWGVVIGLAAIFALLYLSRIPARYALRGILAPLPFLLILAVLQVFITPHAMNVEPILKIFKVSIFIAGIKSAVLLLLKFSGLIILFSIASASISTLELLHGLDLLFRPLNRIGIRASTVSMTLQITFRFIPFLAINAERIAKSQASRGADWGDGKMNLFKRVRQIVPLLVPLFNSSLQQAERLADAMLARGYESRNLRTGLKEYSFNWTDAAFVTGCALAAALTLFLF